MTADAATSATKILKIRTIMDKISSCITPEEDYVDDGKKKKKSEHQAL